MLTPEVSSQVNRDGPKYCVQLWEGRPLVPEFNVLPRTRCITVNQWFHGTAGMTLRVESDKVNRLLQKLSGGEPVNPGSARDNPELPGRAGARQRPARPRMRPPPVEQKNLSN
jgi:hypothetical protein